ncbi:hypothetical protein AAMO2058_000794200 [Amorphochlora amoebiformis]
MYRLGSFGRRNVGVNTPTTSIPSRSRAYSATLVQEQNAQKMPDRKNISVPLDTSLQDLVFPRRCMQSPKSFADFDPEGKLLLTPTSSFTGSPRRSLQSPRIKMACISQTGEVLVAGPRTREFQIYISSSPSIKEQKGKQ